MSPVLRRFATTVGAVSFALIMGGIGLSAGFYFANRPAVRLIKLTEIDGVTMRGDFLELDITLNRNRICNPRVDRWLWQARDGVKYWVALPSIASPPVPLNQDYRYILAVPVPANIAAGQWYYMYRTFDDCPSQLTLSRATVRDSDDLPVAIINPNASKPMEIVTPPGPITLSPSPR